MPRGSAGRPAYQSAGRRESTNLGDILERVLDRGVIIAGDIRVNLLDIELLTIKLRLIIASVDTAKEMGIDWWEHDPWLTGGDRDLVAENRRLRDRLAELEEGRPSRRAIQGEVEHADETPRARRAARAARREETGERQQGRRHDDR